MPIEKLTEQPEMVAVLKRDAGARKARLDVFDAIGERWDGKGVTVASVVKALAEAGDVEQVDVHINSAGGRADHGLAIYNVLRDHPAKVTVVIDGLAASAASLIAMAGDEIEMPTSALMMIHNPAMGAWGDARELRRMAEVLDKWTEVGVNAYAERTGLDKAEIGRLMDAETWLTAEEALAKGFATRVNDRTPVKASFNFDAFKSVPVAALSLMVSAEPSGLNPKGEDMPEGKKPEAGGNPATLNVADIDRYTAKFGAENGLKWLREGKTYAEALELHCDAVTQKAAADIKAAKDAEAAAVQRAESAETNLAAINKGEKTAVNSGDVEKPKLKGVVAVASMIRVAGSK